MRGMTWRYGKAWSSGSGGSEDVLGFRRCGTVIAVPLLAAFALLGCGPDEPAEEPGEEEQAEEEAASGSQQASAERAAQGGETTPERSPRPEPAEERSPRPQPTEERSPAAAPSIPAGVLLSFDVAEPVSTSTHSAGDRFAARLSDAVGSLPAGTPARGVVVEARESSGPEDEAVLVVAVDALEVDGRFVDVTGEVESAQVDADAQDSSARTAAKVATGAAAGAVLGRVIGGDRRGAVGGAAAGAAAGAGVALQTRGGDAVLPEGSTLTVRLEEPVAAGGE